MKKEEIVEQAPPEPDNPLMRKKKTPEELAREAEEAELDDFTSKYGVSDVRKHKMLHVLYKCPSLTFLFFSNYT